MRVQQARRITNLPPYLFAEVDRQIAQARKRGLDVISLGIGDPDFPTPAPVVARLKEAAEDPANHRYPSYEGLREYRAAVAAWYERRFGVGLDPETEVVSLIGSKEGLAHIPWCFIDPGDLALVPDPGYPVYSTAVLLAGGDPFLMRLHPETGWLPDLDAIPGDVRSGAKLMFINYPNNPTAATVDGLGFFESVVEFARKNSIIVCHDAAYSEITFDGYTAPSFLQVPGAKEVGIEFHSLSKTYNMTGWRIGWAAGCREVVEALGRLKTNLDSGIFQAVQYAAITALETPPEHFAQVLPAYARRRKKVVAALNSLGWSLEPPKGAFYVWAPVPKGYSSIEFSRYVLDKAGVFVTPGIGYGPGGEGYFRISVTIDDARLEEALSRLEAAGVRFS
ncbi:MAG: LL-diaminopimelate aminotransferase [Bacillota bacterium]|nr:LL-diaminopimelate aminotransferase [Bacillota bacterium]